MIDLATPEAFQMDPGLVWQFYTHRRYQALQAPCNNGHRALARLAALAAPNHHRPGTNAPEELGKLRFLTLSQNVDGLHHRAKHSPEHLVELHGSLFALRCTSFMCTYSDPRNYKHPLTDALRDNETETVSRKRRLDEEATASTADFLPVRPLLEAQLPRCPACKEGLLRPGVVWFGESLPFKAIDAADRFLTAGKVDLILVIGTSGAVWPGAGYVERVRLQGGKVAIFNTEEPAEGACDWFFQGDAGDRLCEALRPLIGEVREPEATKSEVREHEEVTGP